MSLIVLITGANRGIGLCILERLVQAFPSYQYIIATRTKDNGLSTISDLEARSIITSSHRVDALELDVSSPSSIAKAANTIKEKYGVLDVLINNAGVAYQHSSLENNDYDGLGDIWQKTFMVNVFAPHILFEATKDLLAKSKSPRVINVSSGRASLTRSAGGNLPPTSVLSYSVSKVALNGLGVEMAKILSAQTSGQGRVWNVNPGHCKTAFNGYRGTRDPIEGAAVVEVLMRKDIEGDPIDSGFWEEDAGKLQQIPW